MSVGLKAPFPWFGGKSRASPLIWERFGRVANYVEPFAGSLAVLLANPEPPRTETVNDADGFVANFWRAVSRDGESVARWADGPVNEADLHARHRWLVARRAELLEALEADPDFHDVKIAGWWVWGVSCWIGSGWCSTPEPSRKRPSQGRGVHRTKPETNGLGGRGVHGVGLGRQIPVLRDSGTGVHAASRSSRLEEVFDELQARLRPVRVVCGDWSRVMGPSVIYGNGISGIVLDPPYGSNADRTSRLYAEDCLQVAEDVRTWALEHGDDPCLRIALCGYEGEHEMPPEWEEVAWKANGGYGNRSVKGQENARRERVWFSPHCLRPGSFGPLFDDLKAEETA